MNKRLSAVSTATDLNRTRFEEFCRALTGEELQRPIPSSHWRVTDYIAHLASIDIWVTEWFQAMATGEHFIPRGEDGEPFDIDKWNDARIGERHDTSVEALLEEAGENRARLYATFELFTEETLNSRFNFRGRDISFIEYLESWTLHDPAHAMDMLKALPGRERDPELRSWIGAFEAEAMREVADVKANEPGRA